jgi:hypothetical protein
LVREGKWMGEEKDGSERGVFEVREASINEG